MFLQESITGEIDLPEDDSQIISRLIKFLYTGDFDNEPTWGTVAPSVVTCTKMYIVADKFDVPALKTLTIKKFKDAFASDWDADSLCKSFELIHQHIPDTDTALKEIAVEAASKHLSYLVKQVEFAAMCKADGELAFDILSKPFTSKPEGPKPATTQYSGWGPPPTSWGPTAW